jgi:hypothetical protein
MAHDPSGRSKAENCRDGSDAKEWRDICGPGMCECCLRRTFCLHRASRWMQALQQQFHWWAVAKKKEGGCSPAAMWGLCLLTLYAMLRLALPHQMPPLVEAGLSLVLFVDVDPLQPLAGRVEVLAWAVVVKLVLSGRAIVALSAAWLAAALWMFVVVWRPLTSPSQKEEEEEPSKASEAQRSSARRIRNRRLLSYAAGRALTRIFLPLALLLLFRRKVGLFGLILMPLESNDFFFLLDSVALEGLVSTLCAVFIAGSAVWLSDEVELESFFSRSAAQTPGDAPEEDTLEAMMMEREEEEGLRLRDVPLWLKGVRADMMAALVLRMYVQSGICHAHATATDPLLAAAPIEDIDAKKRRRGGLLPEGAPGRAKQRRGAAKDYSLPQCGKLSEEPEGRSVVPLRAAYVFLFTATVVLETFLQFPVGMLYVLISVDWPLMGLFAPTGAAAPQEDDGAEEEDSPFRHLRRVFFAGAAIDWRNMALFHAMQRGGPTEQQQEKSGLLSIALEQTSACLHGWASRFVSELVVLRGVGGPSDSNIHHTGPPQSKTMSYLRLCSHHFNLQSAKTLIKRLLLLAGDADELSSGRRYYAVHLVFLISVVTALHLLIFVCLPADVVFLSFKVAFYILLIKLVSSEICSDIEAVCVGSVCALLHFMAAGITQFAYFPLDWTEHQSAHWGNMAASWLAGALQAHCAAVLLLDAASALTSLRSRRCVPGRGPVGVRHWREGQRLSPSGGETFDGKQTTCKRR